MKNKNRLAWALVLVGFALLLWKTCASDQATTIEDSGVRLRLATTTSVVDSGLLARLLPAFEKESGYRVEVAAIGSGRALERLVSGEADVVISHAPQAERAAVLAGSAQRRTPFMHNDFVIVGPRDDVASIAGSGDVRDAFRAVAASGRKFFSRGDRSGTHRREQALWRMIGVDASASFIVSTNSGMGDTLDRADKENGYALTDRASYLARRDKLDLVVVFHGDDELRNVYSVVEPGKKNKGAQALRRFVRSSAGRKLIGSFGIARLGEPLFTPAD